jgi:hypothetical protein
MIPILDAIASAFGGGSQQPQQPAQPDPGLGDYSTYARRNPLSALSMGYRNGGLLGSIGALLGEDAFTRPAYEQTQKTDTENQLSGMTLEGYRALQAQRQGPNTAAASLSGTMPTINSAAAPGAPNSAFTAANPDTPGTFAELRPSGVLGQLQAGGASAPTLPTAGSAAPRPLFDTTSIADQYKIAASTPGMQQLASSLLQTLQHGVPEGAYLATDGSIQARPGYNNYVAGKSYATGYGTSQGQLPADLMKIGAQMQADITKAFPIAEGQARAAFPYEVAKKAAGDESAARFDFVQVRDPVSGQTYMVPKVQAYGMATPPAPAPAPSGVVGNLALGGYAGGLGYTPSAGEAPGTGKVRPDGSIPGQPLIGQRGQFNASGGLPGPLQLSPEQEGASKALGARDAQITEAGTKAPEVLNRITVLKNSLGQLGTAFRPGSTADMRLAAGRGLYDTLQGLGITPPAWLKNGITGAETIGKEGGYLAAEMTRALGSREALGVFQAVSRIQPNLTMSDGGFDAIANSIEWGAIRDKDLMSFRDQWLADPSHGGSIRGMDAAFEKQYPVELYASHVIPLPMPKQATALIPNAMYRNGAGQVGMWNGKTFVVQ